MTLPSSGPISLSQVAVEIGLAANAPISLDHATVRALAGKPSGPISLGDLLGKTYGAAVPGGSIQTINLAARRYVEGTYTYTGRVTFGYVGSISPGTLLGMAITELYVIYDSAAGDASVNITNNSDVAVWGSILRVNIGGLTIPVSSLVVCGESLTGVLTAAQYNTIVAAILNKTTPVYFYNT